MSVLNTKLRQSCLEHGWHTSSVEEVAARFLSRAEADSVLSLQAIFRVIRTIPDEVSDPGVAMAKLGWWRTELQPEQARDSQHPIVQALCATGMMDALQGDAWTDYLSFVAARLTGEAPSSSEELVLQVEGHFGNEALMRVGAPSETSTGRIIKSAGTAAGLMGMAQDLDRPLARLDGLPLTWAARYGLHGVSEAGQLSDSQRDGLKSELAGLAGQSIPNEPVEISDCTNTPGSKFEFVSVRLVRQRLARLNAGQNVKAGSLGEVMQAWRAAREFTRAELKQGNS